MTVRKKSATRKRDTVAVRKALRRDAERYKRAPKLAKEETVEFITRFVDLGWPAVPEHKGRGPKPKGTQYDAARKRRRGLYHRLVVMPSILAAARAKIIARNQKILEDRMRAVLCRMPASTPNHQRVRFVQRGLSEQRNFRRLPDDTTVRIILRKWGYLLPLGK